MIRFWRFPLSILFRNFPAGGIGISQEGSRQWLSSPVPLEQIRLDGNKSPVFQDPLKGRHWFIERRLALQKWSRFRKHHGGGTFLKREKEYMSIANLGFFQALGPGILPWWVRV